MPPTQIIEDNIWADRIPAAVAYKKRWENLFKCDVLENYYEGFQWKDNGSIDYKPYTINKFFETIEIKIAEFIPTFPKFNVNPAPANSNYNLEIAGQSAQLKEDILNTIIDDNKLHFSDELELAYKDHFFRFGIIEVGYASDWIINPAAQKPLLNKDVNNQSGNRSKIRKEPEQLPTNERVYIKHIGAKRFHVGGIDHKYLERCSWVGYYEWVYKDDLMSLSIMNKDKVQSAQSTMPDTETTDKSEPQYKTETVKIWHIWDLRAKVRLIVLDSPVVTLWQRKFTRLPLFDYRPGKRTKTEGFYPVPPAFHWFSPQDEINETREQLRAHRRRFIRKFQVIEGAIDDTEIEKFESGQDGALVKVKKENAINAIADAPIGQSLDKAIMTSADDLNRISGTSSEMRGVADRTTATQAGIIDKRSGIRENSERDRIVSWIERIGREILLTVKDKFALGIWVKLTSDPGDFGEEYKANQPAYQWVTSEDLNDGYDAKIHVDVTSISANAQEDEKKKFLEFLAVLTQFPQIAFSPVLIAEAALRVGYRNQKVLAEFQKQALMQELGRQAQLSQAGVNLPAPGPGGQQLTQQATPPMGEQIRQQLQNQVPGVQ